MKLTNRSRMLMSLVVILVASLFIEPSAAQTARQYPALPSETPDKFEPKTESFDYVRREVMIPMREA
jgi:hypothetical protein